MPKVNFYLEKRRDHLGRRITGMRPVMLYFSFQGKRLQVYTGEKVEMDSWDGDNCRMERAVPGSERLNAYLDSLEQEVLRLYDQAMAMGIPMSPRWFRERLKIRHANKRVQFFDVFLEFIRLHTGQWSLSTFKKVKALYNHLREFEQEHYPISFERIQTGFVHDFLSRFRKRGYSNTTMLVYFNMLKWFMNWAYRKGYHRNMEPKAIKFPYSKEGQLSKREAVLTKSELAALEKCKSLEGRWEQTREIFLFMCYTGLKYKQTGQLFIQPELNEPVLWMDKAGRWHSIPLGEKASFLVRDINRYLQEGRLESLVRFNQRIKEIARQAGIRSLVKKVHYSGDNSSYRYVEKHELISSDTARQTFIRYAMDMGFKPEVLFQRR